MNYWFTKNVQRGLDRARIHRELVELVGDRAALEVENAISQVGIEDERQRVEVMYEVIESIKRGQAWATGDTLLEILPCPICEGTGRTRSGRGGCKVCRGTKRKQVPCRACVDAPQRSVTCRMCQGYRVLDPVQDRDLILQQHREWWTKMTKAKREITTEEGQAVREAIKEMNWEPAVGDPVMVMPGGGIWFIASAHDGEYEVVKSLAARDMANREPATRDMLVCIRAWNGEVEGRHAVSISMNDMHNPRSGWRGSIWWNNQGDAPDSTASARTFLEVYEILREAALLHDKEPEEAVGFVVGPMPIAIARALVNAQRRVQSVTKSSSNEGDDYQFTSAEAIYAEARGALLAEGLAVRPHRWKRHGEDLEVVFMYVHESGAQYLCEPVDMPIVLDGGRDKRAADKALATALTYIESQWLRLQLLIPRVGRGEDADARSDVGDAGAKRRARAQKNDEADRAPLSTELNDAVLAMMEAIEAAKTGSAIEGVLKRLTSLKERLPEPVYCRVETAALGKYQKLQGEGRA